MSDTNNARGSNDRGLPRLLKISRLPAYNLLSFVRTVKLRAPRKTRPGSLGNALLASLEKDRCYRRVFEHER